MTADDHPTGDPLPGLRELLGTDNYNNDDYPDIPAPTFWPATPAVDAAAEWTDLRAWVEALQTRFAALDHHVIPRCWWRHNSHVEALTALRDHERSSFSDTAPATAPLDWFRALRDITILLKSWTSDLGCGSTHQDQPVPLEAVDPIAWEHHISADVAARHDREITSATDPRPRR